jgi:hypothetical protein
MFEKSLRIVLTHTKGPYPGLRQIVSTTDAFNSTAPNQIVCEARPKRLFAIGKLVNIWPNRAEYLEQ